MAPSEPEVNGKSATTNNSASSSSQGTANGTTTSTSTANANVYAQSSQPANPEALFSPRTKASAGGVIPGRTDVDLSFVRALANDSSMTHQTGDTGRSVNPNTGTRSRARAVLKPKVVAPKCCSGFAGMGNAGAFEQVRSETKRIRVGFADTVGRRPSMEDQIVISGGEQFDCVGVFDGHNGPHASKFIGEHLVSVMGDMWLLLEQMENSVYMTHHTLFNEIFRKLNAMIKEQSVPGGSTGLLVTVTDADVFIASAGDCRCVIGRGTEFRRITTDHKPDDPHERLRIESCGGEVTVKVIDGHTIARVNGILGVARAFGDFELEDYITCVPDVFRVDVSELAGERGQYLIAACDGLWDVMEDSVVVKTVTDWLSEHADDLEGACKKLRDTAFSNGSTDNISVVVLTK